MTINSSLTRFIDRLPSQQEVSLVIAKDASELEEFTELLHHHGFRQAIDTNELFARITKPSKVFYLIRQELSKQIYDFLVQYPTGQIEIYNTQKMKSHVVTPLYDNISVVFLVLKDNLIHAQEKGFDLLGSVGMTYQSS